MFTANFTTTITNAVRCFGCSPSSKWGVGFNYTFTWGTSKWGEGTEDLIIAFTKVIQNSVTPDQAIGLVFTKGVSNSITPSTDITTMNLLDSAGYYYVFPRPTLNADIQSLPSSFTCGVVGAQAWTSQTTGSVTWS